MNKMNLLFSSIFAVCCMSQTSLYFSSCQNNNGSKFPDDSIIRKEVNEQFELKLEACHSCGYLWFLEPVDTTNIILVSKTSEPKIKDPRLVGGNAIEIWTFAVRKKGDYQLVFHYKRPWLEEIGKTEKFRLIIK